jgi:hypothetical protein
MQIPVVGTSVEIVVDNSFAHGYMAPCSRHRAPVTLTLQGVVIPIPKWMEKHADVAIKNKQTGADNFIPKHRIISIGGIKVEQPVVTKDVILQVVSSKTGETYTVRQDGRTKRWSCTCTGFQFHKKCRHSTRAMEAA